MECFLSFYSNQFHCMQSVWRSKKQSIQPIQCLHFKCITQSTRTSFNRNSIPLPFSISIHFVAVTVMISIRKIPLNKSFHKKKKKKGAGIKKGPPTNNIINSGQSKHHRCCCCCCSCSLSNFYFAALPLTQIIRKYSCAWEHRNFLTKCGRGTEFCLAERATKVNGCWTLHFHPRPVIIRLRNGELSSRRLAECSIDPLLLLLLCLLLHCSQSPCREKKNGDRVHHQCFPVYQVVSSVMWTGMSHLTTHTHRTIGMLTIVLTVPEGCVQRIYPIQINQITVISWYFRFKRKRFQSFNECAPGT